jgi:hypothetical protein
MAISPQGDAGVSGRRVKLSSFFREFRASGAEQFGLRTGRALKVAQILAATGIEMLENKRRARFLEILNLLGRGLGFGPFLRSKPELLSFRFGAASLSRFPFSG